MTKNNDFEQKNDAAYKAEQISNIERSFTMEQEKLDKKINDAACKAEEIASIVHCVIEKLETRDFDFKIYITGALYGVISMCEYLQGDLNVLAWQTNHLITLQK